MLSDVIICLGYALFATLVQANEEVLLDIPQGKLKGLKSVTILNEKPLYSFTGIPYAKAIDELSRFKVAEPPETWPGVYDATREGSGCMSFCKVRQRIVGDDDCLILNVYTPEPNKDARKAVLVWFHGGGFNMGTADRDFYGPDFLVEQDVLLVTINYRLGVFGFISTQDAALPGNVGLKDQTAALKWVQENIQHFGGCPHRVTIFGQSAGGAAVQYHMMSPMSAGLFQQAISQSGSAIASWAITYRPREVAFKLAKALGIQSTDSNDLVDGLLRVSSYEIVQAAMEVDEAENNAVLNGHWHAFIPCVEPDIGQEIFLPADPWLLIKAGKVADVPYMAGLNLNETLFLKFALEAVDYINEYFEGVLPDDLNATDAAESKRIANSIKQFYFGDNPVTKYSVQEYTEMVMDVMFTSGIQIPLTIINSQKSTPTFNYLFNYDSPYGMFKALKFYDSEEGVLHGDEMSYMFFMRAVGLKPERGSTEEKVTYLVSKLWSNFAKTGNPTSTLDENVKVNWEPMGTDHNYAIINQDLRMDKYMFKKRIDFWVSIYENIIGDYIKLF